MTPAASMLTALEEVDGFVGRIAAYVDVAVRAGHGWGCVVLLGVVLGVLYALPGAPPQDTMLSHAYEHTLAHHLTCIHTSTCVRIACAQGRTPNTAFIVTAKHGNAPRKASDLQLLPDTLVPNALKAAGVMVRAGTGCMCVYLGANSPQPHHQTSLHP